MELRLINIEWNLFQTVPLGTARQRISGPFVMVVNIILKIAVVDNHNVTLLL